MTLGLTIPQFTVLHVVISLVAIISGIMAMIGFARRRSNSAVTNLFLLTTAATTITGFMFPINGVTPAFLTGLVSTVVLIVAFAAYYFARLRGAAGPTYAVSATAALWLNLFVLVVQAFQKVPALNAFAPTGSEPPFLVAQAVTLAATIALGVAAFRASRRRPIMAAL